MKQDWETNDDSILSICFDFMQNIYLSHIPVYKVFYKHQLTVNVFHVHNIRTGIARMYVYHEAATKKGPDEMCSFLFDYITTELKHPNKYTQLHLYADNCGGQNKNSTILRFMMDLCDNRLFQEVKLFFLRGHSFNACDRDFSHVKRVLSSHLRIYNMRQVCFAGFYPTVCS